MRIAAVITAVLLGGSLAACGGSTGAGTSENFAVGGTFNSSIATDPGNLDPHQAANNTTVLLNSFAYDTLINRDESGNPVPQLATRWDVTPTSVTFTLRKDVTCADGTPLTAGQVAANFEYIKNPESQSSVIGSDLPDAEFTVSADDTAGTVTISREQPYGFLLPGAGAVEIVCPKGLADRELLANGTDGTGPFQLVESVAGDHYTFAVRKEYRWGPNGAGADVPGFPDKVVFKVVQNPSTGVNLLLSGQLNDVAVLGTERQRLAGKGFREHVEPGSQTSLFYNQAEGHPGADVAVRRALTTAVNIDQFRKVVTEDDGVAPTSLEANKGRVSGPPRRTVDGVGLVVVFAVTLGWLPVAGQDGPASYLLPVAALSLGSIGALARIVRAETLRVLGEDYLRVARSKRLPARLLYLRHVLPNMLTATLTLGGLLLGGLIGGTVLVEYVFSWQGLGTKALHPYTRALVASVPDMSTDRDRPLATIPGRPPGPEDVGAGCAFAPRCPVATQRCRVELPVLSPVGDRDGQRVACWHPQAGPVVPVAASLNGSWS